ncbi:hypothetical protein Fcan01_03930 [Folsomia candida]|uniref:Uncharacterized protein n=1 Tax=Folsomia candida TaxID=158441 RepID=A0A226F2E0_FOLCA|nr:hypothetical protein Fcan01_03930 [Folsomia candida]
MCHFLHNLSPAEGVGGMEMWGEWRYRGDIVCHEDGSLLLEVEAVVELCTSSTQDAPVEAVATTPDDHKLSPINSPPESYTPPKPRGWRKTRPQVASTPVWVLHGSVTTVTTRMTPRLQVGVEKEMPSLYSGAAARRLTSSADLVVSGLTVVSHSPHSPELLPNDQMRVGIASPVQRSSPPPIATMIIIHPYINSYAGYSPRSHRRTGGVIVSSSPYSDDSLKTWKSWGHNCKTKTHTKMLMRTKTTTAKNKVDGSLLLLRDELRREKLGFRFLRVYYISCTAKREMQEMRGARN